MLGRLKIHSSKKQSLTTEHKSKQTDLPQRILRKMSNFLDVMRERVSQGFCNATEASLYFRRIKDYWCIVDETQICLNMHNRLK